MKKFTFKGVLDGFRSSAPQPPRVDQEIVETLRPDHFTVAKTFRHGFPFQPTAVAFDPIQHLLALGTKSGSLRLLGRPGVDSHMQHETDAAVIQIQFLTNEGALVTATADDSIHLWNFRQKKPEVVHSLKFQREKITFIHLPLQSKWLYVGTDKGNIHVVNIENFQLSGYVINWNKAIDPTRKTHPGPVVHLSDNPADSSKLLIGFASGQLVVWDLKSRVAEMRWQASEGLLSVAWHHEGKQFVCSHSDGSLSTWQARQQTFKPLSISTPHAKPNKEGKMDPCKPIQKVEWKSLRATGEAYLIFSGGLPHDTAGRAPSITVIHGKTTTVLEMEHNVVDFITLCESPWVSDFQDPYAIVVLLQNDLVVIDLLTPGFPCFENPYPMDIHESPVTCCTYFADCPSDLIPAFYSVGSRAQKRTGFSEREWPVDGGEWNPTPCSYNEIIITGHADGSIKFWDASAGTLQVLYKMKTAKVFEKPRTKSTECSGMEEDPFAVHLISLCPESRKLCIAGASSHVIIFKFRKQEATTETWKLEIPVNYEHLEEGGEYSPDYEYPPRQNIKADSGESRVSFLISFELCKAKNRDQEIGPLRVRTGMQKKPPGFQAYLVCISIGLHGEPSSQITALGINSSYRLVAYGTECSIVVVDTEQRVCVLNMMTPDLYGSADPYQRVPRSPKRLNETNNEDRCRSPTSDQASLEEVIAKEDQQQEKNRRHSVPWRKKKFSFRKLRLSSVKAPNKEMLDFEQPQSSELITEHPSPIPDAEESVPEEAEEAQEEESPLDEEGEAESPPPVAPPRLKRKVTLQRPDSLPLDITSDNLSKTMPSLGTPIMKVVDLRREEEESSWEAVGRVIKKLNKLDSSFSRSRSSSMSSLENITNESVQCLAFVDSYTKKSDSSPCPTLWVGTSLGSVLTVMIAQPSSVEARLTTPVVLQPCGTIFRLKGTILTMSFLDCNGALIPYSFETWKDEKQDAAKDRSKTCSAEARPSISPTTVASSSSAAEQFGDRQFAVLVSEKHARVVALPSQNCVYRQQLADTNFVVKAEIISLKDSICLVCYLSSGQLSAYSLPSLRPLIYLDFLPLADLSFQTSKQGIQGIVDPMLSIWGQQMFVNEDTDQIARTFCFSNRGHGLYLCSPTEMQKFTVSAEFCQSLNEMVGELFLTREMPEPPKESFFRGLFGGGSRPLDREELFGESSGKASRSVAKHIPGPTLEGLNQRATSASSEVSRARDLFVERGEKLGVLEERAERMRNEAESFSTSAHQLMLKYKDKKWYQL
ncbi:syntaxin-binding protein 5 isoform X3 [Neocloeon triangulifer]|uniref:syntaxin-binding protein 5 isoform X3 n=1 Tax=Neocloeon triangulifer TaxID=2078957 RepID=UPI00286ECCBC|nr:syntaxin-binding protein 5 isoform X3 [Neocloeon triangulifer]